MNKYLKNILIIVVTIALAIFLIISCWDGIIYHEPKEYTADYDVVSDNEVVDVFKPAGVYIIDYINGKDYKYIIDDPETATMMWDKYQTLEIVEDANAQPGTTYLLLRFYNEDVSEEVVFTIYENGTCILDGDYTKLYTVTNGETAYVDLIEIYETSDKVVSAEDFIE